MMGRVCYFIGGPLDLTKSVVQHAESRLFALSCPALTLNQINSFTDLKNAQDTLATRHVYQYRGPCRVHGESSGGAIYEYVGTELGNTV